MAEKDYAHIDVNDKRYPNAWKYVKKKFRQDDLGYFHPIDPRFLARRRGSDIEKKEIDVDLTPSYYIFDTNGRHLLVTRSGFEARDKSLWFPTKSEAEEAKQKLVDKKIASLSKKKKEMEAAINDTNE